VRWSTMEIGDSWRLSISNEGCFRYFFDLLSTASDNELAFINQSNGCEITREDTSPDAETWKPCKLIQNQLLAINEVSE
jgi:hypothetical protein